MSALAATEEALLHASDVLLHAAERVLHLPEPPENRWHRAGISRRFERWFNVLGAGIILILAIGWTIAIVDARATERSAPGEEGSSVTAVTAGITAALTDPTARSTAYLTDAAIQAFVPLRGASGRLRARVQTPGSSIVSDTLPGGAEITFRSGSHAESTFVPVAPRRTGIWDIAVRVGGAIKPVADFNIITLKPFTEKRRGRIGLYFIGTFPTERRRGRRAGYQTPGGFIEVTRENQDTYVSDHFRLRDFLPHDQQGVWPKYLVLETRLVDKLELVLTDLEKRGIRASGVKVMSGFRTPQYNRSGGDPRGRAGWSRHMYGDAADIFIDNDGDGNMDDLNRDGRITFADTRVIEAAVDRVEREHPSLVGGCGVYRGNAAHGPFVHIDTRGFRARWVGSGDG